MKLLIGYDGSTSAEAIRGDLRSAGLPADLKAVVLSATDVFIPPKPGISVAPSIKPMIEKSRMRAMDSLRKARFLAERGVRDIIDTFPQWDVQSEALSEGAAWALIKKAAEWKPDLIAVGAHGHSQIGRFTGSVSQQVLLHAPCSVRVCRSRPRSKTKRVRVIIGFDGSADAEAAIIAASNRAWPEKTEIFLVSALNPKRSALHSFLTPPLVKWVSEKTDNERTILGRMQEAHARVLRRKGCIVTCLIKEGDPKEILIREANAWKADSVFVGARGMSQMKRFLVGGVSSAVAAGAPCSVEVVRTTR